MVGAGAVGAKVVGLDVLGRAVGVVGDCVPSIGEGIGETRVGAGEGTSVGGRVTTRVGCCVGGRVRAIVVGARVGADVVGARVGAWVGARVGVCVRVREGAAVPWQIVYPP